MAKHQIFSLGDFSLECGLVLRKARLAYQVYGKLNSRKTNAILLCSWYSGDHTGYEFLIKKEGSERGFFTPLQPEIG